MKTQLNNDLHELTDFIVNELEALGVEIKSVSKSETTFGNSNYIYAAGVKVRISDHGVGLQRMLEEINVCWFNVAEVISFIERKQFPERYSEITVIEDKFSQFETPKPMEGDIILSQREGKKGTIYLIKRNNPRPVKKIIKK
jgi:hypothetical protein